MSRVVIGNCAQETADQLSIEQLVQVLIITTNNNNGDRDCGCGCGRGRTSKLLPPLLTIIK